ncbi:MAG: hypothetical protein HQ483_04170 [Rhodospirillales bacterium]|nr:hypothetical protein [Rhodospirillales bacterium]
MRMKTVLLLVVGIVLVSPMTTSHAAGRAGADELKPPSSLLTSIASSCVRLLRRGNDETLVNTCNSCQIVGVTRKRRGIAIPVRRSFNVQGGTTFPMPFRGPGNSRITSTQACQDDAADARDSDKVKTGSNSCLELKQATGGKVMLVNACGSCRAAAIQRMSRSGQILNREAFKLSPNDATAVVSQGAAKVSIIADIACPS